MAIGYDPQEVQTLCDEVSAIRTFVDTTIGEVEALMNKVTSDEVFGECRYKDTLLEARAELTKSKESIVEILNFVGEKVKTVGETVGISVSKNMMSVEDQNAAIAAARKKVDQK